MGENRRPELWQLKASFKPFAEQFIIDRPHLKDLILRYCIEIINHRSPCNALKYLVGIFARLDKLPCKDAQKACFSGIILENAVEKDKHVDTMRTRASKLYKSSFIPFAMGYMQTKFEDKTLSRAQVFGENGATNKDNKRFFQGMYQEFAVAFPTETKLKEEHRIKPQKDLRPGHLLDMFRQRLRQANPESQQGLHLLVDAASAICENSALSLSIQGQSAARTPSGSAADPTEASNAGMTMTSLLRMPRCRADSCAAGFVILPGRRI